eukprot:gene27322-33007_t
MFQLPQMVTAFLPTQFVSKALKRLSSQSSMSDSSLEGKTKNICIVGGGFGGLYAALKLSKKIDGNTKIYLIDPKDRFVFLPLLYEITTGTASPVEVAPLYRDLLEGSNVEFLQGKVSNIDFSSRTCSIQPVISSCPNTINYDYLVLSVGNQPRLELVPGAKEHSMAFYSIDDANKLRLRLRELKRQKKGFIRISILGGGYSGVELATNVAQELGKDRAMVTLIDRNNKIMKTSSEYNRFQAERVIYAQGVDCRYNTTIKEIRADGLALIDEVGSEYFFPSDLVLFTAGTVQSELIKQLDLPKDRNGRIQVNSRLQVQNHEDSVFAIGDCCSIVDAPQPLPATAQVALQQSSTLAKNLYVSLVGKEQKFMEEFKYISLGEMLSLGDADATITTLGGLLGLKGPLAALGRRAIYAVRMPTPKQTVKALITASAVTTGKLLSSVFGRKDER